MRTCPECHAFVSDMANFCDSCGHPLQNQPKAPSAAPAPPKLPSAPVSASAGARAGICSACGFQNIPGEMFCQNCGVQLAPVASAPPPPPRPITSNPEPQPQQIVSPLPRGVCAECGYPASQTDVFCQNCGIKLPDAVQAAPNNTAIDAPPLANLAQTLSSPIETPQGALELQQPPAPSTPHIEAVLVLRESGVWLQLPKDKTDIIIGRSDAARGIYPDIDLTPHGGDAHGVSRRHAHLIVEADGIYLEDLNSTNFTFINRRRLEPGQRYLLRHGDEIRVGLLALEYREI